MDGDHNTGEGSQRDYGTVKRRLVTSCVLLTICLLAAITWLMLRRDPVVHGKRKSVWIKNLVNDFRLSDPDAAWRSLGPEAVPILLEAAETKPGPLAKAYAKVWSKLSLSVQSNLPPPFDYARIRSAAAAMLCSPRMEANVPFSVLTNLLQDEKWTVRMNTLGYCYYVLLPKSKPEKAQLLPLLVTATRDPERAVRMCAVNCLGFYPENRDLLLPLLTKALEDVFPDVRIRAAMAFYKLDPTAAERAGALAVAVDCLQSNGPFGSGGLAAQFLQELGKMPDEWRR